MDENTEYFQKQKIDTKENRDSHFLKISIRGWLAIIVVVTVCIMSFLLIEVKEPLYTLAGLIVGFYFGQNQKKI